MANNLDILSGLNNIYEYLIIPKKVSLPALFIVAGLDPIYSHLLMNDGVIIKVVNENKKYFKFGWVGECPTYKMAEDLIARLGSDYGSPIHSTKRKSVTLSTINDKLDAIINHFKI